VRLAPLVRGSAAAAAIVVLLCGCGADDSARASDAPHAVGTLGPGFYDPSAPPAPEATISPRPGSWDDIHPDPGYRVVLITTGDDRPTRTLVTAVTEWAAAEKIGLETLTASRSSEFVPTITAAIDRRPDLVISAGNNLVDALALVTASHLAQQFLVVGAEVAEPTANVTAADWTGASFRGEGLGTPSSYDPGSFTPQRAARAVRAGVAAVLGGLTGIVLCID
jgi:hypothetical protein